MKRRRSPDVRAFPALDRTFRLLGLVPAHQPLPCGLVSMQVRSARSAYPVTFASTMIAIVGIVALISPTRWTAAAALPLILVSLYSLKRWDRERRTGWLVTDSRRIVFELAVLSLAVSLAFGGFMSAALVTGGPSGYPYLIAVIVGVIAVGTLSVATLPLASIAFLIGSSVFALVDVIVVKLPGEILVMFGVFCVLLGRAILAQARLHTEHYHTNVRLSQEAEQRVAAEREARDAREAQYRIEMADARDRQALREQAMDDRRAVMLALGERFERSVLDAVDALATAAREMRQRADGVADLSRHQAHDIAIVTTAAQRTSKASETVRHTVAALSSSTTAVAQRAQEQAALATAARRISRDGFLVAAELTDGARDIGKIVAVIGDIARQTNLLALNATIEAARAGEMGKGFTVVATEVKSLAHQTQRATHDVGLLVQTAQQRVTAVEQALAAIDRGIGDVEEIAVAINDTMAEQVRVTQTIDHAATAAADGSSSLSDGLHRAAGVSGQTRDLTGEVATSSAATAERVAELAQAAHSFLAELRAA